jgi:hypothetical protein
MSFVGLEVHTLIHLPTPGRLLLSLSSHDYLILPRRLATTPSLLLLLFPRITGFDNPSEYREAGTWAA